MIEEGGQRSASAKGVVDAVRGDLITTVPGEVHDGHPMGGQARRWQMVYFEPSVLEKIAAETAGRPQTALGFSAPAIHDPKVRAALRRLFDAHGSLAPETRQALAGPVGHLACDKALVDFCVDMLEGHGELKSTPVGSGAMRLVRERLVDDVDTPPSLRRSGRPDGAQPIPGPASLRARVRPAAARLAQPGTADAGQDADPSRCELVRRGDRRGIR